MTAQADLFGVADDRFSGEGRYSPDIVPPDLQRSILEAIPALRRVLTPGNFVQVGLADALTKSMKARSGAGTRRRPG